MKLNRDDIKHCSADVASDILSVYAESAWRWLNDDIDLYNSFCESQIDHDYSVDEWIWYTHWAEFVDYLNLDFYIVT